MKLNCREAMVSKLDIGAKGAVVTFAERGFPDLAGLLGYIERLKGSAKLRPDSKMAVSRELANSRGSPFTGALSTWRVVSPVWPLPESARKRPRGRLIVRSLGQTSSVLRQIRSVLCSSKGATPRIALVEVDSPSLSGDSSCSWLSTPSSDDLEAQLETRAG